MPARASAPTTCRTLTARRRGRPAPFVVFARPLLAERLSGERTCSARALGNDGPTSTFHRPRVGALFDTRTVPRNGRLEVP
jgi:hypothetical protein